MTRRIHLPLHQLALSGLGMLALALAACSGAPPPAGGYGPGMMGGRYGPGMMGGGFGAGEAEEAVSPATATQLGKATPDGAAVDGAADRVTFNTDDVHLTVLGAPPDGPDETFRAAGLINPTIVVPAGASVTVEFINADDGMQHNWLVTSAQPPFESMGMMDVPIAPVAMGAATATLPEATTDAMPATTVTFDAATPGRYTYLCSVPGHAAEGMYGTFLVTGG